MGQIREIPENYYINVFGHKIKKDNKDECLNFCANDSNCVMATFYDENREYNCKIMKLNHFGNIDLLTNIDNKYWVETKPLTDQNNRKLYHYTKDYANLEVNGNVIRFDWISPIQTDSSSESASDSAGSSGTNQEVASSEPAGSDSAGSSGTNQEVASSESASDSPGSSPPSTGYHPECNVDACNAYMYNKVNNNEFFVTTPEDSTTACYQCPQRGYNYESLYTYKIYKYGSWSSVLKQGNNPYNFLTL